MKYLVIAPSWIGDLIMSQCLYKTIKKLDQNSIIHVLAPNWCLKVLNRMPEIDKSILIPLTHGEFSLKTRYTIGKQLRTEKYDICYILPNSWKSALIPFFAKIPQRIGWIGESRYFLLTSIRKDKTKFPKLIERYASLAYSKDNVKKGSDIKNIDIPVLSINKLNLESLLDKNNIESKEKIIIGICPGAEYGITKKWPTSHYAELLDIFYKNNSQIEVIIFGSQKDINTSQEIINQLKTDVVSYTHMLAGKTSIEDAIDLLSACNLVISNDSGLMHVTAAVNTKLVAIFGSTSTKYTPPTTKNALLIESDEHCHPCFKKVCKYNSVICLKQIMPIYVYNKIKEHWENF
ncbi:MAG: lipopolysaccharide heptosyltransferase II [Succinivibrionaceae bacterium]